MPVKIFDRLIDLLIFACFFTGLILIILIIVESFNNKITEVTVNIPGSSERPGSTDGPGTTEGPSEGPGTTEGPEPDVKPVSQTDDSFGLTFTIVISVISFLIFMALAYYAYNRWKAGKTISTDDEDSLLQEFKNTEEKLRRNTDQDGGDSTSEKSAAIETFNKIINKSKQYITDHNAPQLETKLRSVLKKDSSSLSSLKGRLQNVKNEIKKLDADKIREDMISKAETKWKNKEILSFKGNKFVIIKIKDPIGIDYVFIPEEEYKVQGENEFNDYDSFFAEYPQPIDTSVKENLNLTYFGRKSLYFGDIKTDVNKKNETYSKLAEYLEEQIDSKEKSKPDGIIEKLKNVDFKKEIGITEFSKYRDGLEDYYGSKAE